MLYVAKLHAYAVLHVCECKDKAVIIVRCTAIMWFSIRKNTTDTNQEYSTIFLGNSIFTLFWCQIRVLLNKLF